MSPILQDIIGFFPRGRVSAMWELPDSIWIENAGLFI
jgi:hypothetical protein